MMYPYSRARIRFATEASDPFLSVSIAIPGAIVYCDSGRRWRCYIFRRNSRSSAFRCPIKRPNRSAYVKLTTEDCGAPCENPLLDLNAPLGLNVDLTATVEHSIDWLVVTWRNRAIVIEEQMRFLQNDWESV
jgi:hypothetical protein